MLGGREVANPVAYMRHALAQPDGARYGPDLGSRRRSRTGRT